MMCKTTVMPGVFTGNKRKQTRLIVAVFTAKYHDFSIICSVATLSCKMNEDHNSKTKVKLNRIPRKEAMFQNQ